MTDPNFDLLKKEGDPFEIIISTASTSLGPVLSPYAAVWAKHIYPRREGDGSQIMADWMAFGGSHYTALIRLYHSYRFKEIILQLCKQAEQSKNCEATAEDYSLLLELHGACASFWENLGSAIDNFSHAWDDARRLLVGNAKTCGENGDEPISGKTISEAKYPKLNYAFARRTQFIHWRLVPKRLEDGMIVFNLRHYDDEKTIWLPEEEQIEAIDRQVEKDWGEVINELSSAWQKLFSWLQSKDKNRPSAREQKTAIKVEPLEVRANSQPFISGARQFPIKTFNTPPSGSK